MGAGIVIKKYTDEGDPVYVKLSGIDKARVYQVLAKFGVYEMEPGGEEVMPHTRLPILEHSEIEAFDDTPQRTDSTEDSMLKLNLDQRLDLLNRIDASTMHCCEAAEILFEDIE